jgi:glyoxylase-like metal-dependent hydrolase (beta-lactamase superfamily II)
VLALLLACARLVPEPALDPAVRIDRAALPAATLEVFEISTGHLSASMVLRGGSGPPVPIVAYAYVIHHPDAGVVVIDPGFGRRTVAHPQQVPGRGPARFAGLVMGTPLADQLEAAGTPASSVGRILVTHMHADHSGGIEDFPRATVQITPEEWAFGSVRHTIRATVPLPDQDAIPTIPLDFTDGAYGPFDAHADVFGDGVLIALPTPGHTPGHTAFLVNLPGGSFLLTGDAAWIDEHWQEPALKGRFAASVIEVDGEATGAALWRLRALAASVDGVVVLSGHDPANRDRVELGRVYR